MASNSPRRFYLLTTPRTASNMLLKILNLDEQPNILPRVQKQYFFIDAFMSLRNHKGVKPVEEWTEAEKVQTTDALQSGFDAMQAHLGAAKAAGKDVFIREHVFMLNESVSESDYLFVDNKGSSHPPLTVNTDIQSPTYTPGNTTFLPDEFLKTFLPTFLIRHPAITFPSLARNIVEMEGLDSLSDYGARTSQMSYHYQRTLYDWFHRNLISTQTKDSKVRWPIVIDADDLLAGPEIVLKFSEIVGFDTSKLKFSWEPAPAEQLKRYPDHIRIMLSTLSASTHVEKGKSSEYINLDEEVVKWRDEFGDVFGTKLEKYVRDAMVDYEYLRGKKLSVHN